MNQSIIDQLRHCEKLPSIPAIAQKVIALRRDPDANFDAVATVLQEDSAIAARLLKWANSPFYDHEHRFSTVTGAVRLFGIQDSLTIALNFSLVDSLRAIKSHSLDFIWYWRRSLLAGIFARNLAKYLNRRDEEELFLAALLQDIGMMALDQIVPRLYGGISSTEDYHHVARQREDASINTNHAVVGAWLLGQWGLPQSLVNAIARSHDCDLTRELQHSDEFERTVMLSGIFADMWLSTDWREVYYFVIAESKAMLNLSDSDVRSIIDTAGPDAEDVGQLFDIALIGPSETQQLLDAAAREILKVNGNNPQS